MKKEYMVIDCTDVSTTIIKQYTKGILVRTTDVGEIDKCGIVDIFKWCISELRHRLRYDKPKKGDEVLVCRDSRFVDKFVIASQEWTPTRLILEPDIELKVSQLTKWKHKTINDLYNQHGFSNFKEVLLTQLKLMPECDCKKNEEQVK